MFSWGEHWMKLYNEGASVMIVVIYLVGLLFYGLVIYLTYKNFDWFSENEECMA